MVLGKIKPLDDLQELIKSAETGDVEAQYNLGVRYFKGRGVVKDSNQAVMWFARAAEQGHVHAQYSLGGCYFYGNGVEQNLNQAVMWFAMAAEQGHAHAQYILGGCYFKGDGVGQDAKQAVEWFSKAAKQGQAHAQFALGVCYFDGWGVTQDAKQAILWFTQSAEQGYSEAEKMLSKLKDTNKHKRLLSTKRTEVFISYKQNARVDKQRLDELRVFLKSLELDYGITIWYDEMLRTGDEWKKEIRDHMFVARVAILMISPEFLASEFIRNEELPELLQAAINDNALIIPVPIRQAQIEDTKIKCKDGQEIRLADYQAVCDLKKPLQAMNPNERDKIYIKICEEIKHCFGIKQKKTLT